MALTKENKVDKIEVVGDHKAVQVRLATVVYEDGEELSRQYHRHVVHPDSDISQEDPEVQEVCKAVHTDAVRKRWTEYRAEQERQMAAKE
jgi:phage host-nuclease inhibitor protein Gam